MKNDNLSKKIALITGGSGGIGSAIAEELASRGATVIVNGRDSEATEKTVATIENAGGKALALIGDVLKWNDLINIREQIQKNFGELDVLVACAGGSFSAPAPLTDVAEDDWDSAIDGNLTATFLTLKCFLPIMPSSADSSVITIASSAGRYIEKRAPLPYAVAKAGIIHLTQLAAAQYGPIRINCVAPETILTESNKLHIPADAQQALAQRHPLKRLGTPQDVATLVAFLASPQSGWMSGSVLDLDGGKL